MNRYEHYTYSVHWSPEDACHIGTVAEMPSLSWVSDDPNTAFSGIRRLVADVVADMRTNGETPPEAIADKDYSGKFMVRIPPEAHRRLALEAAEQNISLNRLAATRLAA
ncbi:MAG: type II toxin-antitoxin system HicB family antitoxin [Propionibacteriaceae bacterium]|jgi:predicted HicB family RNase H-like nuclease|nr:type II toxin-antitoxin system HicB family antitoxin [Propionibacteriaceae bacterium]